MGVGKNPSVNFLALPDPGCSLRSWGLDAFKLSGRAETQQFPRGGGEGLGKGREQSRGLGTLPLPLCSPMIQWLWQEGGSLAAGEGIDGSNPDLLLAQRLAGVLL